MKATLAWLAALAALLVLGRAAPLTAEEEGEGEGEGKGPVLVLVDQDGEEVLRLSPEDLETGPQKLPAGQYLLEVGPARFKVRFHNDTGVEIERFSRGPEESSAAERREAPRPESAPCVIDFDLDPGDQGRRRGRVSGPGEQIELQLIALDAPEIYGWSALIEYDPEQVRYVPHSFKPSGFIPGLIPLVDEGEGRVEVGGGNFSKITASGEGDLGTLRFETLDSFEGAAKLHLVKLNARRRDQTQTLEVDAVGVIAAENLGEGDEESEVRPELHRPERGGESEELEESGGESGEEPSLSGQEAISQLVDEKACPGCDLRGANLMQKNLEDARLSGADLGEANLFRANLSGAALGGANMAQANLLQADLREADLREADLSGARLVGAKLQGADLSGANLEGAKLSGANLTGATWVDGSECGRGSFGRCK